MPWTKEEIKEYKRLYHLKNKERILQQKKLYYIENKEKKQSEKGKKSWRISNWRTRGILCFDYNLLYDIFVKTTNCEFCNVELNTNTKTLKCLDHDHCITDMFNVRGVICHSCNCKDVYSNSSSDSKSE